MRLVFEDDFIQVELYNLEKALEFVMAYYNKDKKPRQKINNIYDISWHFITDTPKKKFDLAYSYKSTQDNLTTITRYIGVLTIEED